MIQISLISDWSDSRHKQPHHDRFLCWPLKSITHFLRVFVHVYIHHFDRLTEIEAEAHSNTLFKHYYYFVKEFQLVDEKEFEPLKELIAKICKD